MKRFAAVAVAAGLATASCSGGHGASSMLPAAGVQPQSATTKPASTGAKTTRDLARAAAPAGWANTATQAFSFKNASDLGALEPGADAHRPGRHATAQRRRAQSRGADRTHASRRVK